MDKKAFVEEFKIKDHLIICLSIIKMNLKSLINHLTNSTIDFVKDWAI